MAKQTNKTTTTDNDATTTETKKAPALNRMIVGSQPLMEGGKLYPPKSVVELPAARAKALGKLVSAAPEASED